MSKHELDMVFHCCELDTLDGEMMTLCGVCAGERDENLTTTDEFGNPVDETVEPLPGLECLDCGERNPVSQEES